MTAPQRRAWQLLYVRSVSEPVEPDDGLVHAVRPEPPKFDELVRRPAPFNNESPFRPQVRSFVGSGRVDCERSFRRQSSPVSSPSSVWFDADRPARSGHRWTAPGRWHV